MDENGTDTNVNEEEYKRQLIQEVVELQNTLDDLAQRVDSVKEQNSKLKSENQVLTQYIENLMSSSTIFQQNNLGNFSK
ncbi:hypothetical protein ACHWQZ_G019332 [Mnemiopsis leidyi]